MKATPSTSLFHVRRARSGGFTLFELIVVTVIITVLMSLTFQMVGNLTVAARQMHDLSNMRQIQSVHDMFAEDNGGRFVNVGLGSAEVPSAGYQPWMNTLVAYAGASLDVRSPQDASAHWGPAPGGVPAPGSVDPDRRRITSYGINNFLADFDRNGFNPYGKPPPNFPFWPGGDGRPFDRWTRVPRPGATVQVVLMTCSGSFAVADHPQVETWDNHGPELAPEQAAIQIKIGAYGGPAETFEAASSYGFLDGHSEILDFRAVYSDFQKNSFNPLIAR